MASMLERFLERSGKAPQKSTGLQLMAEEIKLRTHPPHLTVEVSSKPGSAAYMYYVSTDSTGQETRSKPLDGASLTPSTCINFYTGVLQMAIKPGSSIDYKIYLNVPPVKNSHK